MPDKNIDDQEYLNTERFSRLYKRHYQGAMVRSCASLYMYLSALIGFYLEVISQDQLYGVTISILYLILINPPTLWGLKHIRRTRLFELYSLSINFLEIIGYTAAVYFIGGIEAFFLIPIFGAVIAYVGAVGPPRMPFIVTTFTALALSSILVLEYFGIIPSIGFFPDYHVPLNHQLTVFAVSISLLFVLAFISAYTASRMKIGRKRLQEQNVELQRSRLELKESAEALERKNFQLQLAASKARESDRLKSEFLANMSHELRTPLTHIIGFTEIIVDKTLGELNHKQEEYLDDVLKSGRHLLSLINDILDFSEVESGHIDLRASKVHLKQILSKSMELFREIGEKQNLKFSTDFDDIPHIIHADEKMLKQILYNLISNAVKFTPEGGEIRLLGKLYSQGELADSKEKNEGNKSPTDSSKPVNGNFIEISIADTGIGIRPEDRERIFNRFEQGDGSAGRKYGGAGLGLSLTKKLVLIHGGQIWVTSQGEGQGSTFHFTLQV
ncbi:MAG: ATP-binding protein [Thermodesulfobacteriota bacterium]|nr:ATP-binding protein [Thermodesulfobacteriota bacterium]